jgi:hypothetical protein
MTLSFANLLVQAYYYQAKYSQIGQTNRIPRGGGSWQTRRRGRLVVQFAFVGLHAG